MARSRLLRWMPERGIAYRSDGRLGGFRKVPADSPDSSWRNDSFRAYAAHMRTAEFRGAVDDLPADAAAHAVAVMCGESVWWRCHRRMIADFVLIVYGVDVTHLMHDGRHTAHPPTEMARTHDDGLLVYDVDEQAGTTG